MKDLENGNSCLKERSITLEHFETPKWAVDAILKKEVLNSFVIDPCCGTGVLSEAADDRDLCAFPIDIHNWGYRKQQLTADFLTMPYTAITPEYMGADGFSVLMNPPFSKACEFVEKSIELGARKIICFQRFSWWESLKRKDFWKKYPPSRVYICGNRASCWRHDLAEQYRLKGEDLNTKSGTPTAHAWFVWDIGTPAGTLLGHIWKDEA
ncbi:MAG: hypothetical protein CL561_00270 [Alphaproteobacteria bacterium]|nr:hypothetical protein [Alphaproteobacteria bacterium]